MSIINAAQMECSSLIDKYFSFILKFISYINSLSMSIACGKLYFLFIFYIMMAPHLKNFYSILLFKYLYSYFIETIFIDFKKRMSNSNKSIMYKKLLIEHFSYILIKVLIY